MHIESTGYSAADLIPDVYASIFMQSSVCMAVVNADFLLIDANSACLNFFGVSSISELQNVSPFKVNSIPEHTKSILLRGKRTQLTHTIIINSPESTKTHHQINNSLRDISLEINPLFDQSKKTAGFFYLITDISQIKKAQDSVTESEQLYTKAFQEHTAIKFIIDPDTGKIMDANNAAEHFYGWTKDQLKNMRIQDINTLSETEILHEMQDAKNNRRTFFKFQHRTAAGLVRDVEVFSSKIQIHGKELLHSIVHDVSDKIKTSELMKREREQLISILDSIDESIYVADTETYEFLFANKALMKQLNGTPIGSLCYKVLQGRDSPCPFCTNNILIRDYPNPYHWEYTNSHLKRTYSLHDRIIRWPDGRNVRLELAVDISERINAENALAVEKEQLFVTLRSIGDGVITTDIEGNIVLMNRVAEELTGWPLEDAQGKHLSTVFTIVNELTHEVSESPLDKVLSTGNITELANHTLLISRDGTQRIIADSGAPIKDKKGQTTGVVLVFRDTTEKQKFLEMTQNSQKLESLGILAGGLAHDFNNLLGGIYGYIDIARESSKEASVTQYLQKTINTIERARALTQQLLTFAKGGVPVKKAGNLFPFIQEAALFALSGSSITCNFIIADDLKPCIFDKNQIEQVIENLVINAVQAMSSGGSITISARNISVADNEHPILSQGEYVQISVKDTGCGISKEILPKIFDPFFTTKCQGQGLGLPTCYSIMSQHGGYIDVESRPGQGSTFRIYLPASESLPLVEENQTVVEHKGRGIFLVMDDEEIMREILNDMLKSFGYDVISTSNGNEAVEYAVKAVQTQKPLAGMIFDLTVPGGMGGLEAVTEIRKIDKTTPAFIASGYTDGCVMENPAAHGFCASINKPFKRAELMEMLEKYM